MNRLDSLTSKVSVCGVLLLLALSIALFHTSHVDAVSNLGAIGSTTVNNVSIPNGSYSNIASITLPAGNYTVWSILGGTTNGATVNCSVLNGSYHMFDFTGIGEASFIAGVTQLTSQATLNLSCEADSPGVTMTFAQLQVQVVGVVKGTVNHD